LPWDLVARIRDVGLFGLALPRSLGGLELTPTEIVETVEELSRADGSTGWTVLVGNSTAFLAWLEPSVAAELLAERAAPIGSATFAPTGALTTAAEGRFRLEGRWSFASGSARADWFLGGALVMDDGRPRTVPGRGPDWRLAVVPTERLTLLDTWDGVGLVGTGSHDFLATELDVVAEHTMCPFFEPARHDGPLWRLPFFTLVGVQFAGFPLGVARRALDELAPFVAGKVRVSGARPIADDGDVQLAVTRAEGALQSARSFVMDRIGSMCESALAGDVPDDQQRARFLLANMQAMHAATEAVDIAFAIGGASAVRADSPLQRCFRDIHAAAAHIYYSTAARKRYARSRLGIAQDSWWF
jgi:indole-3-acetate monooxygenase